MALSTQQSHSFLASGVMSSQVLQVALFAVSTSAKSAGILSWTVPTERVFVGIVVFYYKRYTECINAHRKGG